MQMSNARGTGPERSGHGGPRRTGPAAGNERLCTDMMLNGQAEESGQTQLIRRIAAQDKQALAELYDQVASVLFATSFRILRDPHEAEEVIQDVFVQIWNKAASFDAALGTPFHWTVGIARNRSIDRLRSRQRHTEMLTRLQTSLETEFMGKGPPVETTLSDDELAAVRAAVHELPADQRRALELAFFSGLTHAEIAQATGEPLGTVKARIRRGMLKLRDTLQAYA